MKDPAVPAFQNDKAKKSSIIFLAVFADRYLEQICTDSSVDGSIMNGVAWRRLSAFGEDLDGQKLAQPRVFDINAASSVGKPPKLLFSKEVLIGTELHIRHGSAVELRNVTWPVTNRRVSQSQLGRPSLDGLGLNTCEILAAAADCFGGTFDEERLLGAVDQYRTGLVSGVMEGGFHADHGEKEGEEDENTDVYCDIGEQSDP